MFRNNNCARYAISIAPLPALIEILVHAPAMQHNVYTVRYTFTVVRYRSNKVRQRLRQSLTQSGVCEMTQCVQRTLANIIYVTVVVSVIKHGLKGIHMNA